MGLRLDAIKFNHDPSSASVDAFNIRKNESVFIEPPEWRRGININPEDSPAAYSLFDTRGNTLTIQASFSCEDQRVDYVDIRALDGRLYPKNAGDYFGSTLVTDLLRPFLFNSVGNVLGEVEVRNLRLSNGASGFKTFNLKNVRIWNTGVGVQDIVWRWQYRISPFGPWTDFATSTHRIYTTLTRPREPWQQTPFNGSNLQLPWAAVLEYACRWAATAQNPTDAATRITQSVYQLGRDGIAKYFTTTQYTNGLTITFKCAAFLFDLKLGTMKLNCTDCATIVSTFANILGAELWQSKMVNSFDYNPIIRIGESRWRQSFFNFHVVAWEEDCDVHNDVFDACLQIDGDENPTSADPCHLALLPTDLRFGRTNENLYRNRLVAPTNSPDAATPVPDARRRRAIQSPIKDSMLSQSTLDFASKFFAFDFREWARELPTDKLLSVGELPEVLLDGWWTKLRSERTKTTEKGGFEDGVLNESLWRQTDELLLIEIYEGSSIQKAREWLHHSIAGLHSFDDVKKRQVDLVDVFFTLGGGDGVIFSLSNVTISLVNVGKDGFSVESIANSLLARLAPDGEVFQNFSPLKNANQIHERKARVMAENTSEQNAAATMPAKQTPERKTDVELKLSSSVIIIDDDLEIKEEGDGDFVLKVTPEGVVTGTHSHPAMHDVSGTLRGRRIRLDSDDGDRRHIGILIGDTFRGLRRPLRDDQEEGVWAGTKVG